MRQRCPGLRFGLVAVAWLLIGAAPACPPGTQSVSKRYAGLDYTWCVGRRDKDGPFVAQHPSGARAVEGAFADGSPNGAWSAWYANGQRAWRGATWRSLDHELDGAAARPDRDPARR